MAQVVEQGHVDQAVMSSSLPTSGVFYPFFRTRYKAMMLRMLPNQHAYLNFMLSNAKGKVLTYGLPSMCNF